MEHGPGKRAGSEPERGVGAGRAAWSPMDAAKAASNQLRIALACGRARAEAFCTARGTCGLPGARRVAGGACSAGWLPGTDGASFKKTEKRHFLNLRIIKAGKDLQDHQVQLPTQPHHVCSTMSPRATSTWCLNPSRVGDSTIALGSLGQGLTTLAGKKFFPISNLNLS